MTYGLGTENENLPGFVTICPSSSKGGPRNYGNAFLPAIYQGTRLGRATLPAADARIENLTNANLSPAEQRQWFEQLQQLNRQQVAGRRDDDELSAVVESYELAYRMQTKAPQALDMSRETPETLKMYGIDEKHSANFGRQCLMARRMAEAGVRYIQVNYSDESPNPRWDQHSNMPKHMDHARATGQTGRRIVGRLKATRSVG